MQIVVAVEARTVTALSSNTDGLWENLMQGTSAIAPIDRFSTDGYVSNLAACIPDLEPPGSVSRIDPLLDRLLENVKNIPRDSLLITATTKFGIDNIEKWRNGKESDISKTIPGNFPESVRIRTGIGNKGVNVSAACASGVIAISRGAMLIAHGVTDSVFVCCADLLTEFVYSGFSALKALSPNPCRPFDKNRDGLTLGEGAACVLLMSLSRAKRENRRILGKISGWGTASDATHITAPARDGCGLSAAITSALNMADTQSSSIDCICAHGTGTIYNDMMELTAFRNIFGKRRFPIFSVKGAMGHTLGAAGAIETVLSLMVLETNSVPPTTGCYTPETCAEAMVSDKPVHIPVQRVLTTNSGFGGINGALILERMDA